MNPLQKQEYIRRRFMGQSQEQIKKDFVEERKDQIGASVDHVVQQLLGNAKKAYGNVQDLMSRAEKMDCITPAKKQVQQLRDTHSALQKVYNNVQENYKQAQEELAKQLAQKEKLKCRLADAQRTIRSQPDTFRFSEPSKI